MEPDSKWTRYARILIMKALDPEKYHQVGKIDQNLHIFQKVKKMLTVIYLFKLISNVFSFTRYVVMFIWILYLCFKLLKSGNLDFFIALSSIWLFSGYCWRILETFWARPETLRLLRGHEKQKMSRTSSQRLDRPRTRSVGPRLDSHLLQRTVGHVSENRFFEEQAEKCQHSAALSDRLSKTEFRWEFDRKCRRIRSKCESRRNLDS